MSSTKISQILTDPTPWENLMVIVLACEQISGSFFLATNEAYGARNRTVIQQFQDSNPFGSFRCFFCHFRLCRAADGHDRPDQGAESQPGHSLFGVQTVCHTHVLPQGEEAYFSPLSDFDWQTDNTIFLNGVLIFSFPLHVPFFSLLVICRMKIHLETFKHTVDI